MFARHRRACVCVCACVSRMKRQSDLVQGAALAFAERVVLDACVAALTQSVPTYGESRGRGKVKGKERKWDSGRGGGEAVLVLGRRALWHPLACDASRPRGRAGAGAQPPCCRRPARKRFVRRARATLRAGAAPSPAARATLERLARLYAARCVEADIAWFLGEGVLPVQVRGWGEGGPGLPMQVREVVWGFGRAARAGAGAGGAAVQVRGAAVVGEGLAKGSGARLRDALGSRPLWSCAWPAFAPAALWSRKRQRHCGARVLVCRRPSRCRRWCARWWPRRRPRRTT